MSTTRNANPDQLSLFAVRPSRVPERFLIDDATRARGRRHVAELKALLAARHSAADEPPAPRVPLGARAHQKAA